RHRSSAERATAGRAWRSKFRACPTLRGAVWPSVKIARMTDTAPTVAPTLAKSDQNLVWLDCEMSGLDPEKERLLEIAVVVTGPDLTPRVEGPVFAIHQSDAVLNAMDAWNKGTHGR